MCIRFVRERAGLDYVLPLMRGHREPCLIDEILPSWNISPGTRQPVIHSPGVARCVRWGSRIRRGKRFSLRAIMDVGVGAATSSACWRTGRVIVPGDGWFEWLPAADGMQPYFIRRIDGEPLFMAALIQSEADTGMRDDAGFVIVVAAAGRGLVDPHARRPVVFAAPDARVWIDVATTPDAACELAHRSGLTSDAFHWFPVDRAVNQAGKSDGPGLIARVTPGI